MSKLVWDEGLRPYDTGVDRGVIFTYAPAVPWNGLLSIKEKNPGGDSEHIYLDGVKYKDLVHNDDFEFLVEAYAFPQELEDLDGIADDIREQVVRGTFGFTYRTLTDGGYKIHIVYNCTIAPNDKEHGTINEKADTDIFQFDISTVPVSIPNAKPSAHLVIDTTLADPRAIEFLENEMYGSEHYNAYLPAIDQIEAWFAMYPGLTITLGDDGDWTADGPDYAITVFGDESFEIVWPSVLYLSPDTYKISTL